MGERLLEAGRGDPALLLLHGFTGSADAWTDLVPLFGKRIRTLAIDLPGHGPAGEGRPFPRRITPSACVAGISRRLDALQVRHAFLLGYSMGARIALRFALDHPERVKGLVLESAAFGIRDPDARAAREEADDALADSIMRDGLAAFVEEWMRQPLFRSWSRLSEALLARERAMRMDHEPAGLAAALRGLGQGTFPPAWESLPSLEAPVLLVAGEADGTYREAARAASARIQDARVAIIPGAGHATHLEEPTAFVAAVEKFLTDIQGESR